LIEALSGSNQTFDQVERQTAYLNLMITLVNSIPSVIINLVAPLMETYGRKSAMILVLPGEAAAVVNVVIIAFLHSKKNNHFDHQFVMLVADE